MVCKEENSVSGKTTGGANRILNKVAGLLRKPFFITFFWISGVCFWIVLWIAGFRDENRVLLEIKGTPFFAGVAEDQDENCIDINTSGIQSLILLPGIGPALADRIVKFREESGLFKRASDLGKVKGIGPEKLKRIENRVCF
ncbi:MAG TPA: ComEA family DNA-binding protein [Chitinispirillaceae bacterium]|nr:ComEA family DNA-binding protein [Chitinispirillaceae bacterium]